MDGIFITYPVYANRYTVRVTSKLGVTIDKSSSKYIWSFVICKMESSTV